MRAWQRTHNVQIDAAATINIRPATINIRPPIIFTLASPLASFGLERLPYVGALPIALVQGRYKEEPASYLPGPPNSASRASSCS